MRYSYFEIYVGKSLSEIDIRDDYAAATRSGNNYAEGGLAWIFASNGLKYFVHPKDDDTVRLIDVRIPETHPLFNIGIVLDWALFTPEKFFDRLQLYGGKEFRKDGIPVTLLEAEEYDEE